MTLLMIDGIAIHRTVGKIKAESRVGIGMRNFGALLWNQFYKFTSRFVRSAPLKLFYGKFTRREEYFVGCREKKKEERGRKEG